MSSENAEDTHAEDTHAEETHAEETHGKLDHEAQAELEQLLKQFLCSKGVIGEAFAGGLVDLLEATSEAL